MKTSFLTNIGEKIFRKSIVSHIKKVGNHWNAMYSSAKKKELKAWWDSEFTVRHINRLVFDIDSPILSEGLNQLLIKRLDGRRLKTGISVGCGLATKEIRLLELGIVEKFILFELSEEAIRIGSENAKKSNVIDRVEFRNEDAFQFDYSHSKIDLVHWNNSLHHMFDVPRAVQWSYEILIPGGVFYMDDYVGSNRFQWPQNIVDIVNEVRGSLPHKYLKKRIPLVVDRIIDYIKPHILQIIDPSEAVDSEKILTSVRSYFPKAEIILTGGIVYFIALEGMWRNFNEKEEDLSLLTRLLEKDKFYTQSPDIMSPYAVALAIK